MLNVSEIISRTPDQVLASAAVIKSLIGASNYAKLGQQEKILMENARWSIRNIEEGHTLLSQGEDCNAVLVIMSGWSFSYQTLQDGKRQILDFALGGTLLGFGANRVAAKSVETLSTCIVASLPTYQFYGLLTHCPHFAVQVAECIVESELRAHEHLTHVGRRNARERVAALVVELMSRSHPKKAPGKAIGNDEFDLPLSLSLIADALGLSCEHVCRTLAKLFEDRVLEMTRHSLRILDSVSLHKEAGVDEFVSRNAKTVYQESLPAFAA
jgi:CRP/FNR family transcriptional regulator, anaerobic regulatory protein